MGEPELSESIAREIADALEDAPQELDPERIERVRQLLRSSAAARRYYLETNALIDALSSAQTLPPAPESVPNAARASVKWPPAVPQPRTRRRTAHPRLVTAAAVAAVSLVVAVTILSRGREAPVPDPRMIASLEQVNGHVSVTTADAETHRVVPSVTVRPGDTIRTHGSLSSALLAYPDGTRLSLAGNTALTLSDTSRKRIVFHGGTLFGSVTPGALHPAMLVITPRDRVQVLGRFALGATSSETDLSVSQGRVRLTRLDDGKSVEILPGRRVVSQPASELVDEAIPPTPDEWSEDFEEGLPANWGRGRFVMEGLPAGSRGAVQAVRDVSREDGLVQILSPEEWNYGLFKVHEDTHLHFTLKMRDSGWFNLLILTKTADSDVPRFAGNYIFDRPVWKGAPDEWGTITIPLKSFRPLSPSRGDFENAIPFQILFSSPDRDRGLVIDRIWVTRGGPGSVQVRPLP